MCKSTTMYTPRGREEASSYLAIWGKKRAEHSRQLATWLRRERGLEHSKQLHQQVQRPWGWNLNSRDQCDWRQEEVHLQQMCTNSTGKHRSHLKNDSIDLGRLTHKDVSLKVYCYLDHNPMANPGEGRKTQSEKLKSDPKASRTTSILGRGKQWLRPRKQEKVKVPLPIKKWALTEKHRVLVPCLQINSQNKNNNL